MIKFFSACQSLIMALKDTYDINVWGSRIYHKKGVLTRLSHYVRVQEFATRYWFSIIHKQDYNMKLNKMQRKF